LHLFRINLLELIKIKRKNGKKNRIKILRERNNGDTNKLFFIREKEISGAKLIINRTNKLYLLGDGKKK
jgi:hypothetical protein